MRVASQRLKHVVDDGAKGKKMKRFAIIKSDMLRSCLLNIEI